VLVVGLPVLLVLEVLLEALLPGLVLEPAMDPGALRLLLLERVLLLVLLLVVAVLAFVAYSAPPEVFSPRLAFSVFLRLLVFEEAYSPLLEL